MTNLSFDRWAFDSALNHRRFNDLHKPAEGIIGIAHSDYERMHMTKRELRNIRFVPAWAASDEKMRHVLALRCWWYAGKRKSTMPEVLAKSYADLNELVNNRELSGWNNLNDGRNGVRHDFLLRNHGGFLALHASILYKAYRQRLQSRYIAAELGVTANAVRQWLLDANRAARELGYECFSERHWTHGRKVKWIGMRKHVVKLPQEKPCNKAAD